MGAAHLLTVAHPELCWRQYNRARATEGRRFVPPDPADSTDSET